MTISKRFMTVANLCNCLSLVALLIAILYVGNQRTGDSSVFDLNSLSFASSMNHEEESRHAHQSSRANSVTILPSTARQMFQRDGYIVLRGLLDSDALERLKAAGKGFMRKQTEEAQNTRLPKLFHTIGPHALFLSPPGEDDHPALNAFREVSLESLIPKVVAELMGLDPAKDSLRVVRDIFLAKGPEEKACGWHVDGISLWPTKEKSPSNHTGINAWIAIDDMPAEYGGSMVVSPGSHAADWKFEAYRVIGSLPAQPNGGDISIEEYVNNTSAFVCDLHKASPDLAKRIDATTKSFDLRRGDIIFADRWLFHKTTPLTEAGMKFLAKKDKDDPFLMRYSVRYEPGDSALISGGLSLEESILLNPENAGRTLDDVAANDQFPWYPKAWPAVDEDEIENLMSFVSTSMQAATIMRKEALGNFLKQYSGIIHRYD
eukprot:CAMPEP_0116031336 /NCGR_PEP_ID=MMETSP0321-20121206/17448_1 /TAXON_ID=163516 /ORGANISM="Leptocylindrus danicus var. danicus, Strain B650" /LENGTH=432 /DNA_ID=CAMNT_0003506431 /DNA_START=143 /DNA_END=1441 /DNA_ORIENTATION=-